MSDATPIRYLDAADVARALPPPGELVDFAELVLRSLIAGAQIPRKAALSDADSGLFAHAMPARLTAAEVPGGGGQGDLLGMKWIAGAPGNRAAGRPAMAGLIVLNDPVGGQPVAILDGSVVTAARTAALSGVAVRLLAPSVAATRAPLAVLVGAGAQGSAHAAMLGAVLGNVQLAIHDRHPERAQALARSAVTMPGIVSAHPAPEPASALREADIVISATSLGASQPVLGSADVAPGALVIPVDYDAYVTPELVVAASTFAVDDRDRYAANRRAGRLVAWPEASVTLGELLLKPRARPAGVAVALHQGPGIADVVVGDAVLRRAAAAGLGILLDR